MHSSQFGITFTDSRGPVNSDGPIHCIRSLNRMVQYSVMPLPGYWEPAPSIPAIFRSTNEYRHDILQQPEAAGGYNRTTNNCECIDCSILVFLDCFLSVI